MFPNYDRSHVCLFIPPNATTSTRKSQFYSSQRHHIYQKIPILFLPNFIPPILHAAFVYPPNFILPILHAAFVISLRSSSLFSRSQFYWLLSGLQDIEYLKLYSSRFGREEGLQLLEKTGM